MEDESELVLEWVLVRLAWVLLLAAVVQ